MDSNHIITPVTATQKSFVIGFYWVKTATIEGIQQGEWQVAFYNGNGWETCGEEGEEGLYYFDEIGERIICPYHSTNTGCV